MSSIVATNISSFAKISPVKGFVFKGKRNLLTIAVNDFYPESMASLPRIWTDVDRMVLHVCSFNAETGTATEIVATADTDVDATLNQLFRCWTGGAETRRPDNIAGCSHSGCRISGAPYFVCWRARNTGAT